MMLEEFEQRTGFYPTLVQYAAIERAYMEFDAALASLMFASISRAMFSRY